ncbi:MAG: peptidylprolyl isomerase [Oscillospiraceae bacterium]
MKKLALLLGLILVAGCSGRDKQSSSQEDSLALEGDASVADPATNHAYQNSPAQLLQFQEVGPDDTLVVIETTLGTMKAKLFPQKAPKAVANFIGLAEQGYYTGKIFHRVIPQFMAQGGSPNGDGLGGESIYKDEKGNSLPFEDEFSMDLWHFRGALSMANSGPNSNLSQFFIVEGYPISDEMLEQMTQFPAPVVEKYRELGGTPHLDWRHTVFGQVVEGMEVLEAMMNVETRNDKPLEDIIILSVQVENAAPGSSQ